MEINFLVMKKYILLAIPAFFSIGCESFDMEGFAKLHEITQEEGKTLPELCKTKAGLQKIENGGLPEHIVAECQDIYNSSSS